MVGDEPRAYWMFVPSTLEPGQAVPAVVVLHDATGTPDSIAETTQFNREATASGFIVVYPEAVARNNTWNAGFCCGPAPVQQVDDLGFLSRVLDDLREDRLVDPQRVYVVGVSNGAVMAYRLGCEQADRVAGVGSVAGVMLLDGCSPKRPIPVIAIHGTADPLVPYEGAPVFGGVPIGPPGPLGHRGRRALGRTEPVSHTTRDRDGRPGDDRDVAGVQ